MKKITFPHSNVKGNFPFVDIGIAIVTKVRTALYPVRTYIFNSKNKPIILTVFLLSLVGDIFFIANNSDLRFFGLTGFYILIHLFYRVPSKYTFLLCLVLLVIMYGAFLTGGASPLAEKTAVWIFFFMAVGIGQQWFENEQK